MITSTNVAWELERYRLLCALSQRVATISFTAVPVECIITQFASATANLWRLYAASEAAFLIAGILFLFVGHDIAAWLCERLEAATCGHRGPNRLLHACAWSFLCLATMLGAIAVLLTFRA